MPILAERRESAKAVLGTIERPSRSVKSEVVKEAAVLLRLENVRVLKRMGLGDFLNASLLRLEIRGATSEAGLVTLLHMKRAPHAMFSPRLRAKNSQA